MPSGAKKRKAAKKKKEIIDANSNSLQGDDDFEVNEEKDESIEQVNGNVEQKSSVQIEQETKFEDNSKSKAVFIEHVEIEDVYTSSSSSSDDESKFENKDIEVINWEEPIEYAPNLEKSSGFLPKVTQVNEIVSHDLAPVSSNEESHVETITQVEDIRLSKDEILGLNEESREDDLDMVSSNEESHVESITQVEDLSLSKDEILGWNEESCEDDLATVYSNEESHVETITQVEPLSLSKDEILGSNEESREDDLAKVSSNEKSQVEPIGLSKDEILGPNEKGKNEIFEVLSSEIDIGSQSNMDTVSKKVTEDCEVTKIASIEEGKSETLPQSSAPTVYKANGTEHKKECESESMDTETQVSMPPRPVQVTSSMGCCGLFELCMGSNR